MSDRTAAVALLGDVLDALDAASPALSPLAAAAAAGSAAAAGATSASWWWQQVRDAAAVALSLAAQLSDSGGGGGGGSGGGAGIGALLPAMRRLADVAAEAAEAAGGGGGADAAVWADWLPELAALAMAAGDADRRGVFALMAAAAEARAREERRSADVAAATAAGKGACWRSPEAALLAAPLLHGLVLLPDGGSRRWAAALLAAAQAAARPWRRTGACAAGASGGSGLAALCCQGELVVVRAARALLARLWAGDDGSNDNEAAVAEAVAWLRALAASVAKAREAAAAAASGAGAGAATALTIGLPSARDVRSQAEGGGGGDDDDSALGAGASAELGPGATALLGALLLHADARVVDAAARCLRQLALASPASAPVFLAPLLLQLQRLSSFSARDKGAGGWTTGAAAAAARDVAAAQASLLGVLPAMTADATTAAFAMRALQPLAAPSAPPALRGAALRLAVEGWLLTGRGWARAEAALNGYAPPGSTALAASAPGGLGPRARDLPPLELRLARAAALRAACASGSGRALELAWALQDALADPCPAVAAAALDALRALCADDALDFYKAWAVVAARMPAPPAAPLLASRWVALLGAGAFDAEAHAEQAAAAVDLLWAAAEAGDEGGAADTSGPTAHPVVRAAAYGALAAYPPALLERIEADAPPAAYTRPLRREAAALAAALGAGGGSTAAAATLSVEGSDADAAARALAAAEALAGVAIVHEHGNRRRFIAAAAGGRAGAAGGAGAAASREEAALRHRLLRGARDIALAGADGASSSRGGAVAGRGGAAALLQGATNAASPGAALLLWQAPAAGGGAASNAGGAYARLFDDAAARLAPSPWTHPGLAAAAWAAFMARWLAAAASGAEGLLQRLRERWREGAPGDAAAACWAAAGLAAAGALGEAQTAEALAELKALARASAAAAAAVEDGGQEGGGTESGDGPGASSQLAASASSVGEAAAAALARMLPALHPADWKSREGAVAMLRALLLGGGCGGGAAAAEALSFAVCHALRLGGAAGALGLAGGGGGGGEENRGLALAIGALGALLARLEAADGLANGKGADSSSSGGGLTTLVLGQLPGDLRPRLEAALSQARGGAVTSSRAEDAADAADGDPWLPAALRRGVVAVAAALHEARPLPALLAALQADAARLAAEAARSPDAAAPGRRAAALAAVAALQNASLACLDALPDGGARAAEAAAALAALARTATVDGWVGGAAALGWARLAGALLQRGEPLQPPAQAAAAGAAADPTAAAAAAAAEMVEALSALCAGRPLPDQEGGGSGGLPVAHRGPAAHALRCGVAAGLAALLGADVEAGAFGVGLGADGLPAAAAQAPCWLLSPSAAGGSSAAASRVRIARSALRALEAAALGGDARGGGGGGSGGARLAGGGSAASAALAPLASWLLAAVSAAASAGGAAAGAAAGSGGSGGGAQGVGAQQPPPPPLAAYPADGALRPLAERLLMPGCGDGPDTPPPPLPLSEDSDGDSGRGAREAAAPSPPPGPVEAAALLRVLAAAPRLPAAGWDGVCRRLLLRPPAAVDAARREALQQAALRLALAHAHVAPLGLSAVVDQALMPAAFAQLPPACRAALLRRLPDAVRCLPANRAAPLLQSLPALASSSADAAVAAELEAAAWDGLAALCRCLSARDAAVASKGVVAPLLGAVAALGARLPALPPLQGGQVAALLDAGLAHRALTHGLEESVGADGNSGDGSTSGNSNSGSDRGCECLPAGVPPGAWRVWAAALRCLRSVRPEQAAALTALGADADAARAAGLAVIGGGGGGGGGDGERAAALRAQLRCLLVAGGVLSWRDLTPCRAAVVTSTRPLLPLSQPPAGAAVDAAASAALALLPLLAEASRLAPQAAQAQALDECLRAAALAAHPGNALLLAAALAGAWQAALQQQRQQQQGRSAQAARAEGAVAAVTDALLAPAPCGDGDGGAAAEAGPLAALPYTLPRLLSAPAWAPSADGIAAGLLAAARLPGLPAAAARAATAAVVAVRHRLRSAGGWEALATAVALTEG